MGSSTGQYEFIGADQDFVPYSDFGSGDIPLTEEDYELLNATILHVPFSLGAMSFFHNVPGAEDIRLTACVLADIFRREIVTWDDAEILNLNPELSVPANEPILVYHRDAGSSTTDGITTYLNAACPEKWPESLVGPEIEWVDGTFAAQGSSGMSEAISNDDFSIGYIDSGHGQDDGLNEVRLENAAGTWQISTEAIASGGVQAAAEEALQEGVLPSDPSADFSQVSLHNMPGESTWPIVAISYIYLRADQTFNGETGPLLKAFVEYVLSDEGQSLLQKFNFVAVPEDVKTVAFAAVDLLRLAPNVTEWTFESDEETLAGIGQLDYIISGKRRSFNEYAINELAEEKADASVLSSLELEIDG